MAEARGKWGGAARLRGAASADRHEM